MILCIDTATAQSGIALTDGKKVFFEKLEARHASDQILGNIDKLIKKSGIELSDLRGVFVIKGPGSFTGLRVGIAVANQFAHQLKIPIIGLQTDEWYQYQTDEKDFVYLQTMNRDQVYMAGLGKYEREFPPAVISISECHYEFASRPEVKWMGQLSDEHKKALSDTIGLTDVRSTDDTWLEFVRNTKIKPQKIYNLIEPFYGKKPTITKSKRSL